MRMCPRQCTQSERLTATRPVPLAHVISVSLRRHYLSLCTSVHRCWDSVHKVAGAAAAAGLPLADVAAEAAAAAAAVGSMGVATSACTLPGGQPSGRCIGYMRALGRRKRLLCELAMQLSGLFQHTQHRQQRQPAAAAGHKHTG